MGEAVSFTLRDALFEEGRDISNSSVLADIASDHDIDAEQATYADNVRRDWYEGQARGVKGSPHFFCGQNDVFCPSLDIEKREDGHLLIRRNLEALNSFLDNCFLG
jgi:hypothetical protein